MLTRHKTQFTEKPHIPLPRASTNDLQSNLDAKISSLLLRLCCHLLQGYYFTGDGCKRDKDGYFWITGKKFMYSYQGSLKPSMNGMPASHCILHSRTQSPKTSMCLCMPCQPLGGLYMLAIHPSVQPSIHLSVHPLLCLVKFIYH